MTEAEGAQARRSNSPADADLYAAEQAAKARRVLADAEAYATARRRRRDRGQTGSRRRSIRSRSKQVEALNALGNGAGKQTIIVPAAAIEAFGDAFKLLRGRG